MGEAKDSAKQNLSLAPNISWPLQQRGTWDQRGASIEVMWQRLCVKHSCRCLFKLRRLDSRTDSTLSDNGLCILASEGWWSWMRIDHFSEHLRVFFAFAEVSSPIWIFRMEPHLTASHCSLL